MRDCRWPNAGAGACAPDGMGAGRRRYVGGHTVGAQTAEGGDEGQRDSERQPTGTAAQTGSNQRTRQNGGFLLETSLNPGLGLLGSITNTSRAASQE